MHEAYFERINLLTGCFNGDQALCNNAIPQLVDKLSKDMPWAQGALGKGSARSRKRATFRFLPCGQCQSLRQRVPCSP